MESARQNPFQQQHPSVTKPKGWGERHTLVLLGFFAFAVSYNMRWNLSMAIVSMVNQSKSAESQESLPIFKIDHCPHSLYYSKSRIESQIPLDDDNNHDNDGYSSSGDFISENDNDLSLNSSSFVPLTSPFSVIGGGGKKFNWNDEERGIILGSFFYGYLIVQIPGGTLATRYSAKWILSLGLLATAILTFISPFAATLGKEYFIAVRIFQGIGEGLSVPCMHSILEKWLPARERTNLSATIYAGMSFGTGLTMALSGYLIQYCGWPFVFYQSGILTIIWFVFWTIFVFDSPGENPRISETEFKYISHSLAAVLEHQRKPKKIPWWSIARSGPFWAILLCSTLETYGHYTLLHQIPSYFHDVLHFDIEQVSMLSAFPNIIAAFVSILVTKFADILIEKKILTTVAVRRICNTIGLWGTSASMLAIAYSGCDRTATTTLIALAIIAYGVLLGGVLINLIDIAPNLVSILMGIVNSCATLSGFISPWVAGHILEHSPSLLHGYKIIFVLAATICFVANLIYILLVSGKEQKWNSTDTDSTGESHAENENNVIPNIWIPGLENQEQQDRIDRIIALVEVPNHVPHFQRSSA